MALRHIEIGDRWRSSEPYRPKPRKLPDIIIPPQPRDRHGESLRTEALHIQEYYTQTSRDWTDREHIASKGIIIEFESEPGVRLATEGWSDRRVPKFDLLNETLKTTQTGETIILQRWFIRDGAFDEFVRIFSDYLTKNTKKGEPRHRSLVDSINQIRLAALGALWTDRISKPDDAAIDWYEVWLRAGDDENERKLIIHQVRTEAEMCQLSSGKWEERLPEHTVIHIHGAFGKLGQSVPLMNCIAEIRPVQRFADFYEHLPVEQQHRYVKDLRDRLNNVSDGSLAVCLLDTGVERGHLLLEPLLSSGDNLTINDAWGTSDDQGHGTPMAGLAAYGNLTDALAGNAAIDVSFVLEAAKILPPKAILNTDEKHAAEYTAQGIAIMEVANPKRKRIWCIATSMVGQNDGRPSSWSSRLDQLVAGVDNQGEIRRMLCVSAGNVDIQTWNDYPRANLLSPVENPGQAWNALCVGSTTDFTRISDQTEKQGYSPIAQSGAMAPSNRTSIDWDDEWPAKPDIVMEGGNAAGRQQKDLPNKAPELQLLSTEADFRITPFCTFDGTSAATALAARMAGIIQSVYPEYWAETVRGLMIHCADWTPAMEASVPMHDARGARLTDRKKKRFLLNTVGYGVPQLSRALIDQPNCATMITQAEMQPFRADGAGAKYNEYHIYSLPWPHSELERFWEEDVRMRVTLSYFIEPNPGNRISTRYRYPGCRLKFKVSSPGQKLDDLKAEVNKFAAEDAEQAEKEWLRGDNNGWLLGPHNIFKGSVHTDIWEGSAANLLSMKHIVVFPTAGWWKTRLALKHTDSRIKYSLIISLEAPGLEVDLYTEIASQIAVPIELPSI